MRHMCPLASNFVMAFTRRKATRRGSSRRVSRQNITTYQTARMQLTNANVTLRLPKLDELTAKSITLWLNACEVEFQKFETTSLMVLTTRQRIAFALASISDHPGSQASAARPRYDHDLTPNTWDQFRDLFRTKVLGTGWELCPLRDFYSIQQLGSTVSEYFERLDEALFTIERSALVPLGDFAIKSYYLLNASPLIVASITSRRYDLVHISIQDLKSEMLQVESSMATLTLRPPHAAPDRNDGLGRTTDTTPFSTACISTLTNNTPLIPSETPQHAAACVSDIHEILGTADSDLVDTPDGSGRTPRFYAFAKGHLATATALLRSSRKWKTPIPPSVAKDYILDNTPEHKARALYDAIRRREVAMVGFLLEIGADPNARGYGVWPEYMGTALHEAAFFGPNEVIQMLLDHGADRRATDKDGATAAEGGWMCYGHRLLI
ncbi:ankyrin repeat-containing domain protein [Lasiosphaeria miniovina]|uniref:Ankyrin repeat-containing domain protein n=1 Tax=Lasiosphaeria miniovina TaxID=1954250 RepID=A0AA40E0N2_9PEZI|nr:ankyrin repeat-containing domain protein [Lasiosphaeria miniovina]KAK0722630.1 ankyrin repeat-containing domain protein [Lasiosphaeria miniovina]